MPSGTDARTASRISSRDTSLVTAAKKPSITMFCTIARPRPSAIRVEDTPKAALTGAWASGWTRSCS